jgi:sugar phosphate permease
VFQAAVPIGAAIGFILGGYLEKHHGWRNAFFVASLPGLFAVIGLLMMKEPKRGAQDPIEHRKKIDHSQSIIKTTIKEFWSNKTYHNAVFGYTAFTFCLGGFASWCPKYSVAVKGMELAKANFYIGLMTVGAGVGGTLLGGFLAGRLRRLKGNKGPSALMVISSVLAIPFTFACFLASGNFGFFVCLGISQFLLFVSHSPVNVIIVESIPFFIRGTALALTTFVIHILGDLISPPLIGWIADNWSLQAGMMVLPTSLFFVVYFWGQTFRQILKTPAPIPVDG